MNRDEAIAIIRKEYLCVDRDCDIERSCGKCDLMMPSKEPILEAYKMAIKALEQEPKTDTWSIKDVADTFKKHGLIVEQEPCEDAVSRQYLIDIATEDGAYDYVSAQEIANAPSVNPQPKTGHCKDCKWWKDSDGTYCRGVHAESKCPINRKEVYEGNGYCYMFEPQES